MSYHVYKVILRHKVLGFKWEFETSKPFFNDTCLDYRLNSVDLHVAEYYYYQDYECLNVLELS